MYMFTHMHPFVFHTKIWNFNRLKINGLFGFYKELDQRQFSSWTLQPVAAIHTETLGFLHVAFLAPITSPSSTVAVQASQYSCTVRRRLAGTETSLISSCRQVRLATRHITVRLRATKIAHAVHSAWSFSRWHGAISMGFHAVEGFHAGPLMKNWQGSHTHMLRECTKLSVPFNAPLDKVVKEWSNISGKENKSTSAREMEITVQLMQLISDQLETCTMDIGSSEWAFKRNTMKKNRETEEVSTTLLCRDCSNASVQDQDCGRRQTVSLNFTAVADWTVGQEVVKARQGSCQPHYLDCNCQSHFDAFHCEKSGFREHTVFGF